MLLLYMQLTKKEIMIQRYYVVTDFIPHIVHFTPVTPLFCSWTSAF